MFHFSYSPKIFSKNFRTNNKIIIQCHWGGNLPLWKKNILVRKNVGQNAPSTKTFLVTHFSLYFIFSSKCLIQILTSQSFVTHFVTKIFKNVKYCNFIGIWQMKKFSTMIAIHSSFCPSGKLSIIFHIYQI